MLNGLQVSAMIQMCLFSIMLALFTSMNKHVPLHNDCKTWKVCKNT